MLQKTRTQKRMRVVSIILSVACVALGVTACSNGEEEAAAASSGGQQPAAPVVVATVESGRLIQERSFFAQVRSKNSAALSPSAPGEVVEIDVREGDRVEEGQVIVRVNARAASANLDQLRSQLASMQAELAQAERDADRARRLAERQIGSTQAAEQAETTVDSLRQQVGSIRANIAAQRQSVSDHVVRAPFSGVVTERLVDLGDFVQPGTVAVRIASTDELEVFVRLPEDIIAQLDEETGVTLRVQEREVDAEVAGVVGVLDESTRSALVRLTPNSAPSWLRPGASVNADLALESDEEGLLVPTDAVVYGVARPRVIRMSDGAAQPVDVFVVATGGERALIQGEGLAEGDKVVTRGNERLRPGQPLRVESAFSEDEAAAQQSGQTGPPGEASEDANAQQQDSEREQAGGRQE